MHMPLRKALKLRKALETALSKVELPLTVDLPVLVAVNRDNPGQAVAAGTEALRERLARQMRLSGILRNLRVAIARENVEAGVDEMLALAADIDRCIAYEKAVAESEPTPVEEQLTGEIGLAHEALRSGERRGYGEPARKVTASVVPESMREQARTNLAGLRRQREEIEDRRIAANSGRGIEIADDDVALLRDAGIV